MTSHDRDKWAAARFADLPASAGQYESFYIKATRPGGGQGVWIRYTIHKRPGEEPNGSLWFTLFDAEANGPQATKLTVPASELAIPSGAFLRIGDAVLEPGSARGAIEVPALSASWDLSFSAEGEPFHHLPYDFLYRASLPKTKPLSPYPSAHFSGSLVVGGERIDLDDWPGMVGHNWGSEHAERWIWMQAPDLGGRRGDYLDMACGRIKIGRFTTPWVANGAIVIDGELHRLGGLDKVRATEIDERPDGCRFTFPGKDITVSGSVSAPQRDFVAWVYADPDGPEHNTANCSIADLEISVDLKGEEPRRVQVPGAAAYELGMRETDHGIPLQPFSDG